MRLHASNASLVLSDTPSGSDDRAASPAQSRPQSPQGRQLPALALRLKGNTAGRMRAFLAQQNDGTSSRPITGPRPRQTVLDLVRLTNDRESAYWSELIGVVRQGGDGQSEVELRMDRFLAAYQTNLLPDFLEEQHRRGLGGEEQFLEDTLVLFKKFCSGKLDGDEQLVLLQWLSQQYGAPDGGYIAKNVTPLIAQWETRAAEVSAPADFSKLVNEAVHAVRKESVALGRTTFMEVLLNTIGQYDLDESSESHAEVSEMWHQVNDFPEKAVSGMRLQYVMDRVGRAMRSEVGLLVPNAKTASDAPRDAKRMPNDCAIQWAARLREMVAETSDPTVEKACEKEYDAIYGHFLRHDLTFEFTRDYFALASSAMEKAGCASLAKLASELLHQLPGAEHDDFDRDKTEIIYKTALHDNPYGRVFGTMLCTRIQKNPPPSALETLSKMSMWFQKYLFPQQYVDEEGRTHIVLGEGDTELMRNLRDELANSELNWKEAMPQLVQDFRGSGADAPENLADPIADLVVYLGKVQKNPESSDFMPIAHLICRAMVLDPRSTAAWSDAMQKQYVELAKIRHRVTPDDHPNAIESIAHSRYAAKSIDHNEANAMLTLARHFKNLRWGASRRDAVAGITLAHQPEAVVEEWRTSAPRSSNAYLPNFGQSPIRLNDKLEIAPDDPAVASHFNRTQKNRLRHGEPFGTDLSGVTNMFLHAFEYETRHGERFDLRAVLNIVAMYLNLDGGHDPSECYGVARLLDGREEGKIDLQLDLGNNSPDADFVFNYHMMDSPINPEMDDYLKEAFEEVLDYHDELSHYASAR